MQIDEARMITDVLYIVGGVLAIILILFKLLNN